LPPGLPDFSWYNIPKQGENCVPNDHIILYQTVKNIPNDHIIDQTVIKYVYKMAIKIPIGKIEHHFPFQGLPKYSQIEIFGMHISKPSGNISPLVAT
jgi:hypothetical protein